MPEPVSRSRSPILVKRSTSSPDITTRPTKIFLLSWCWSPTDSGFDRRPKPQFLYLPPCRGIDLSGHDGGCASAQPAGPEEQENEPAAMWNSIADACAYCLRPA